jgi:hypothetical protein
MDWFRWHHGTVTDAKWRYVAVQSSTKVADVIAVWACMMEHASQAEPRGTLTGWRDVIYACLLDLPPDSVHAIRSTMEDVTLDGEQLTAWEKRQPKREDPTAVERKRAQRERGESRDVTQRHAPEKMREDVDTETTPSIHLSSRGSVEDEEEHTSLVIRLANRGMCDNPEIDINGFEPILPSHGTSRQAVADWRAEGIDWTTIEATVYDRATKYKPSPRYRRIGTMAYFTRAVQDAHERAAALAIGVPAGGIEESSTDLFRGMDPETREWAERLDAKLRADELAMKEAERIQAHLMKSNEAEIKRMRKTEADAYVWIRVLNWYSERAGDPRPSRKLAQAS